MRKDTSGMREKKGEHGRGQEGTTVKGVLPLMVTFSVRTGRFERANEIYSARCRDDGSLQLRARDETGEFREGLCPTLEESLGRLRHECCRILRR